MNKTLSNFLIMTWIVVKSKNASTEIFVIRILLSVNLDKYTQVQVSKSEI